MGPVLKLKVINYTNYRLLLKDFYEQQKLANPKVSHRYIAQKVGFSSSGLFSQILSGKTNMSSRLVVNFAAFMKLSKKESEYFELLVKYNQAKSHEETKYFYQKLLSYRKPHAKNLEADQFEYLNKWYYIAIRQLLAIYPFKGNYAQLAKMVVPSIKPSEAEAAIKLLIRLELVTKNAQGVYQWVNPTLTTGEKSNAVSIQSYLNETIGLAQHALNNTPKNQRDIASLTVSISKRGLEEIEERTKIYRADIQNIAERDSEVDRVYQLNLQLFPMSQSVNENKK